MRSNWRKCLGLVAAALFVLAVVPRSAFADDQDPPSRVARLSFVQGQVSFNPAGTDDWAGAEVNRPMTTGDKLWSDRDGRAELQIGSAVLRMGGETGFSFLNLSDNTVQVRMTEGVLSIRLSHLDRDDIYEVDTPNIAFTLQRPGEYRFEVNEDGSATVVNVRAGEGEATAGGSAFTVHEGQRVSFSGTDQLSSSVESVGDFDDFDNWCHDRDSHQQTSASSRYVSPDVTGYEDLDANGDWQPAPDYGYVWVPRIAMVGWAPYRYGHWVWVSPWGWTWVDAAPWGFAPFHYGRWVFWRARWCWVPGPVVARPVYAPALVAWVGGPRFGVNVGIGAGVGWFPLGPREVFVPAYAVSRLYVTNINVTNTTVNVVRVTEVYNRVTVEHATNITYINRAAPGGVTVVSRETFTSARAVHTNLVRVDDREIAAAQVNTFAGVAPGQRSVLGAGQSNVPRPRASFSSRAVVARTAPPPRPVSFAAQQRAIEANGGRPLSGEQLGRLHADNQGGNAPRDNVRVAPPPTRRMPIEMVGRPGGNAPTPPPASPAVRDRVRDDRPPAGRNVPGNTPPSSAPARGGNTGNVGGGGQPGSGSKIEEERQKMEQRHAREQEDLRVRQEREHQKLEQKAQRQEQHQDKGKPPKSDDRSKSKDRKN